MRRLISTLVTLLLININCAERLRDPLYDRDEQLFEIREKIDVQDLNELECDDDPRFSARHGRKQSSNPSRLRKYCCPKRIQVDIGRVKGWSLNTGPIRQGCVPFDMNDEVCKRVRHAVCCANVEFEDEQGGWTVEDCYLLYRELRPEYMKDMEDDSGKLAKIYRDRGQKRGHAKKNSDKKLRVKNDARPLSPINSGSGIGVTKELVPEGLRSGN